MGVTWKPSTERYARGSDAFLGKVAVGRTADTSGVMSKGDKGPAWVSVSLLPGLTMRAGTDRFHTEDEAKARFEKHLQAWLAAAGIAKE